MKNSTQTRAILIALFLLAFLNGTFSHAQICSSTIAAFPYSESFEGAGAGGLGAWIQDGADNGNWTIRTGGTPSGATGPSGASHLNYYIFTEASSGQSPGSPNRTAFLNSPCFNLAGLTNPAFDFDYHMFGVNMGNLKVQISTSAVPAWTDIGWSQNGQLQTAMTDPWTTASINLSAYAGMTIALRFHGTTGADYRSDMAVDNVNLYDNGGASCSSTVSTFPYNEGFEGTGTGGIGAWIQDTADNGNWTIRTGGTPSATTGPSAATEGSYYLFTESSSGQSPGSPNNTAFLNSPCFDLTGLSNPQFDFSYHMYGANMGTLKIQVSTDSGASYADIGWTRTGQQNSPDTSPWLTATINLSAYIGQTINLRFHGTTGADYTSDMAIDGVSLYDPIVGREMDVLGNGTSIADGDTTPVVADDTDFGSTNITTGTIVNTFTISNLGSATLSLIGPSPYVTVSGAHAADFTVTAVPSNSIAGSSSTTFDITFNPSVLGLRTATITILNNDTDENPYNFDIQGTGTNASAIGPGGITNDLELWLKSTDGLAYSNGQPVSLWQDQGNGQDATVNTAGQEPTYRDDIAYNVNFNPVVDFDNSYSTFNNDGSNYTPLPQEFLEGSGGFYTDDIFFVIIPDVTINQGFEDSGYFMDCFTGDADPGNATDQDVTGIGMGAYSARYSNEVISYAQATETSYGVAETSATINYDNIGIINARNNTALNGMELYYNGTRIDDVEVNVSTFSNLNDTRYWIGRSQVFRGSMDARIAEIITFSARKNNASERLQIETYLALKYGITLGVNGTSQDYEDSSGNVVWDVSANAGFNYDIAGIARDDNSELSQKQSKSINSGGVITIGLGDVALTNSTNTNVFLSDQDYLMWGHDGNSMSTAPPASDIVVNLGPTTVTTITERTLRTWKVVESGGDVPTVKISVFQSDLTGLPALTGNDAYVMVVADDSAFSTNVESLFLTSGVFNGSAVQEITYDFDGTRYFTLGVAHEVVAPRHLEFDGIDNYTKIGDKVDLVGNFTASAWVRTNGSNAASSDKTIVAKHDGLVGYKFTILNNNTVRFSTGPAAASRIDSNVTLNTNIWHHVAVTYNGTVANLYIDGVLDQTNALVAPGDTNAGFAIGAVYENKTSIIDYFSGDIDEIKIFNTQLSAAQIQYMMNQEIEKSGTGVMGKIVPNTIVKNDISGLNWGDILVYYNMNTYIGTHLNDASGNANRGSLVVPDKFSIVEQTAPLPYESTANGDWTTKATWVNGAGQYIPGSTSIVDNTVTVDWNIVRTSHNVVMDNASLPVGKSDNRTVLGLFVNANELEISADNGLTVSHYLKLDGFIDLEGESQLIQTNNSELDVTSSGYIERDQQGTADVFTYNYWSSPVGTINTTVNNQSYTIPSLLNDGTTPSSPLAISFLTSGYNGTAGSPIGVADYWLWKFANQTDDDYSLWQHVRSTGTMLVGEGFTMKGPGTGTIATPQNYVFNGKPNNADISVTISAGNDYLVGNPYPSALDTHEFLDDNPLTGGTVYFWEHWGGGSHVLADYQGGYAQYNYSGGLGSASYGTNDPDVGTGGTPVKLPGRYIPVAQGFFVYGAAGGTINFENDQRAFVKESASSVFVRSVQNSTVEETDTRMKFRIGFNSVNRIHRQLLLTVDQNATSDVDWGYDGIIKEEQMDDMYWMIEDDKYLIQGTNLVDYQTVAPLGIHTRDDGENSITIDKLENVPDDVKIYVRDKELDIYHNLRESDYKVFLTAGEYLNRFEIVFQEDPTIILTVNEISDAFEIYYSNTDKEVVISNPEQTTIDHLEIRNILGQIIQTIDKLADDEVIRIKVRNLSSGSYIIKLNTGSGPISKKVLVK